MIKMIIKPINCILEKIFPIEKEIEYSEAIKMEWMYYTTQSVYTMKHYKKPHIGQKFLCQDENKMFVYVGNGKFICMSNVYI